METVIRLKINPEQPIIFEECHPTYEPDTREVVILDLECGVQAVYDADVLVGEIIWRW